jgi:hypothetical protein
MPIITPPQPSQTRVETARAQLRRGEEEAQAVRDEIASVRNTLTRENAAPAASRSPLISDLNTKLAQLERSLETRERENSTLRRQIAEVENDDEDDSSDSAIADRSSGNRRISGAAVPAPSLAQSPAGLSAPVNNTGGGAQLAAPSAGGSGQVSSLPGGSGSSQSNPLFKYSETPSGAITISEATSAEYQQLLSRAEGDAYSESFPNDVFERIRGGDTGVLEERFRDRLPVRPGEVRLYRIQKEGSETELVNILVSRTETGGLFVTYGLGGAQESAPEADRAPASRTARREDLVREVAPGSN